MRKTMLVAVAVLFGGCVSEITPYVRDVWIDAKGRIVVEKCVLTRTELGYNIYSVNAGGCDVELVEQRRPVAPTGSLQGAP